MGQKVDHTKKSEGCVALKIAMAYERSLHFEKVTREQAERGIPFKRVGYNPGRYQMFSGLFVLENM